MTPAPDLAALEARLADLAAALELPATPPLRDPVLARIRAARRAPARPGRRRRALLALVAAVAALGASLAIPRWRDALAGWLGIHGVVIEQRPGALPSLTPRPSPPPGPAGSGLDLGAPTTLAGAAPLLGFTPLVPSGLGLPDAVWLRGAPPGTAVSLVYAAAPRRPPASVDGVAVLVTEVRATFDTRFLAKVAGPGTTITEVAVGAEPAVWIAGSPHDVFFVGPDGSVADDTLRLATNTLLWQHGPLLVRIEGTESLEQAEAVATSMIP